MRKPGLGRGLSALLDEGNSGDSKSGATVRMLPIDRVQPNPDQPRRHFDADALAELSRSVEKQGVLQPILVRSVGDGYQIIAGERRWRAAQQAQLHEIPALIRDSDDAKTAEIALIENIQREDLNALEEAKAYQGLSEEYGRSQAEIGTLVGKSRSHVANLMRLLDLPESVQRALIHDEISMGHARALVGVEDAEALAAEIASKDLTVRETEALVRARRDGGTKPTRSKAATPRSDPDLEALERQLGDVLGLKVAVRHGDKGGTVQLRYRTLEQLDMVCQRLSGEKI